MSKEQEVITIFDRPGDTVAPDISKFWMDHEDRQQVHTASEVFNGHLLGLQTNNGVLMHRINEVIVYTPEYTMGRWPYSRGPQIESLPSGSVICYGFHKTVLTFFKTQGAGNIMLSSLVRVDRLGNPLEGDKNLLKAGGVAKLVGLSHMEVGRLTPFNFRDQKALLLSKQTHLTDEELDRLDDELFRGLDAEGNI